MAFRLIYIPLTLPPLYQIRKRVYLLFIKNRLIKTDAILHLESDHPFVRASIRMLRIDFNVNLGI